jgi:hypothetical protein
MGMIVTEEIIEEPQDGSSTDIRSKINSNLAPSTEVTQYYIAQNIDLARNTTALN